MQISNPKREATFKSSKKKRKDKYASKTSSSDETDEEETNFVKKLIRGISKHKGNIPFRCFNCGSDPPLC